MRAVDVTYRILPPIALAFSLCASAAAVGCRSEPPKPDAQKEIENDRAGTNKGAPKLDDGPAGPLGRLPAGPVAFVKGDPISLEDFRKIYDLKLKKYENRRRPMTRRIDTRYRRSITERLIWSEVLRRESEALGVSYDPAELEEMVKQDRLGARDWEKDKTRRGENEETLRALHVSQLQERAILEHEKKLVVTPEEVDAEYERAKSSYDLDVDRVRLAQIVIEHGDGVTKEAAMAEAKEVYEAARAPDADFGKLAEDHSDVVTRQMGGDLGIQRIDRMDPQLTELAKKLEVGQVSKPIETPAGIQLIKLVARWGPGPLPKDAIIDQLQGTLYNRKLQEGRLDLEKRLYDKYEVKSPMLDGLGPGPAKPGAIPRPPAPSDG